MSHPQPVHTIAGGFCTVCGDIAEWLSEQGAQLDYGGSGG